MTEAPALEPIDPHDPDVQAVAYIDLARRRGIPWAAIAKELRLPDKRYRRELDHRIRLGQIG